MLAAVKQIIANQFEAAFCTLSVCIDGCPDDAWNARVGNYPFSQVVFHTLFYADFYLGQDEESFGRQPFHVDNQHWFGDYEQLEDREPVSLYDWPSIRAYLEHCRRKATDVIAAETEDSLTAKCGLPLAPILARRAVRIQHPPYPTPRRSAKLAAENRFGR